MSNDQLLTARRGFLTKGKLDVVSEGRHIRGHQASGKFAIMEDGRETQCFRQGLGSSNRFIFNYPISSLALEDVKRWRARGCQTIFSTFGLEKTFSNKFGENTS